MKAVSFGQADAALGELAVFNHLMARHLMTDVMVTGEVKIGDHELSLLNIATRKDLPVLASILTKGVQSLGVEEMRAIQRKWLGEDQAETCRDGDIFPLLLDDLHRLHPACRCGVHTPLARSGGKKGNSYSSYPVVTRDSSVRRSIPLTFTSPITQHSQKQNYVAWIPCNWWTICVRHRTTSRAWCVPMQ